MTRQDDHPKSPRDLRRQAREIADSLAIAFILAMIIRHFVLEVFKIPTKSMEPTLLGDPWSGDKILVSKFAYDFRGPQRWEVAVFKYPRDTSKNYIKRIVGLPGDNLRVRYGDVYINGAIARKPWRVQEELWRLAPYSDEAKAWRLVDPGGAAPHKMADREFTIHCSGEASPVELVYQRDLLAYEAAEDRIPSRPLPRILTSDIMAEFQLVPRERAGTLSVEIAVTFPESPDVGPANLLDYWEVKFPLDRDEIAPEVWRGRGIFATGSPCRLPLGRPTLVQVCNVDRTFLVRVGVVEVVRRDYEPSPRVFESGSFANEAHVRLTCQQAHVTLRRPGIYVDVYYTDHPSSNAVRSPYHLGPDEFFAMGDNSANSNDSRAWGPVPRSYLVGEAFLVLWPLGRMRFVR